MMSGTKNEQGFSMVELLIAMVLIGVLFVAVMTGFSQALVSTGKLRSETVAMNLAKQRLEFLKQYDNKGINRDATQWTEPTSPKTINGITYNITTQEIEDDELEEKYKDKTDQKFVIPIRVTVSWLEYSKNRSISMETFYYEKYFD
jgi:prepilin-type N-terminal cleavage/methylation domain-containing protein